MTNQDVEDLKTCVTEMATELDELRAFVRQALWAVADAGERHQNMLKEPKIQSMFKDSVKLILSMVSREERMNEVTRRLQKSVDPNGLRETTPEGQA